MSLPRYGEYKDSGLDWLPTVPSHWDVCALKRVASLKSGDSITSERITEAGDYPVYGGNGLRGFTSTFTHEGRFALVGRQGALCGNVNYSHGKFWASEHAVVATPIKPAETTWLGELLRAMDLNQYSVSAAQPGLSVELISNIGVPYPPLNEQTAIAAFLDRETAKIDALIAEQEKLIALLAEKRQAAVSHAVTRGLNPDATMKDSGVAWLGEVPAHWHIVPIKRVIEVRDGTHATPEYVTPAENTFPLITSKDFGSTSIDFEYAKHISQDDHVEIVRRSNTQNGDVLMSMIGGNIGKALVVNAEREFSIKNVALFKTTTSPCLAKYLLYYLQSGLLDIQVDLLSRGGAQGFLGLGDIRNLVFFKIPGEEMQNIVRLLDERLTPLAQLFEAAKRSRELLSERRSAVISAAVTGQIDVRDVVNLLGVEAMA